MHLFRLSVTALTAVAACVAIAAAYTTTVWGSR